MKTRIALLLSLLAMTITAIAQQSSLTQTIKGTVIDQESEVPLIGVNVSLVEDDLLLGTTTDLDGNFQLENIPVGRHTLLFTYIGYGEVVLPNILVNSAKEVNLSISMAEKLNELSEIVISADQDPSRTINEMATVSTRTMSVEEMSRFSGTIADPARMAQNYAGVSGASDDRNDIIIRGNSPTGVLWRMEGVDIPSPNHFSTIGTTGGPVSMLNINNLKNSDFLSSAFPAEYGNATSGVFDLQLRNGNYDKFEFLGQIGFNGFELGAEGPLPFGKNASFLANYRYSTLAVFDALGLDLGLGSAVPDYQDLTFKINVPTEKAGRFTFWGVTGNSDITFEPEEDEENTNLFSGDNEYAEFESATSFGGISHTYFFNDKTYSKVHLAYSNLRTDGFTDTISVDGMGRERVFWSSVNQERFSVNTKFNRKLNAKNRITLGIIYDIHNFDAADSVTIAPMPLQAGFAFDGQLHFTREYVQWQHKFSDAITLNTGISAQQLHWNNTSAIDPRIGLRWDLDAKNSLSFGSGIHSQMQPTNIYFQNRTNDLGQEVFPNQNLEMFKSLHNAISWDHGFNSNLRLKVETYYQHLYDIAVDEVSSTFSMINTGADFVLPTRVGLVNEGIGRNYGLELTLEKFFSNNFYYLSTISLFNSEYQGSDGVWRNTLFNSNYVINALAGKEFPLSEKMTLTLDGKLTFAGGRRYTPIDVEASRIAKRAIEIEELSFEEKYDPYFRADLKIGFRRNSPKFTQTFFVDFQNITNRQNNFLTDFNNRTGELETSFQRGFFPDVRYQILF